MAPDKSAIARWIEPPFSCRIGNDDRRRSGLLMFDDLSTLATLTTATSALPPSPVATAATAAALVPLIAVELLAAGMLPLTVLLTGLPLLCWRRPTVEPWWRRVVDRLVCTVCSADG